MSKINSIVDVLELGIRAEGLRQSTISSNVANMESPGYRRIDVKFEELLAKALKTGGTVDLKDVEPAMYQPKNTAVRDNGNDVNLEVEVGEMVRNSLRHRAFVRLLDKIYKQMDAAINVR